MALEDWLEKVHPATGEPYFFNKKTRKKVKDMEEVLRVENTGAVSTPPKPPSLPRSTPPQSNLQRSPLAPSLRRSRTPSDSHKLQEDRVLHSAASRGTPQDTSLPRSSPSTPALRRSRTPSAPSLPRTPGEDSLPSPPVVKLSGGELSGTTGSATSEGTASVKRGGSTVKIVTEEEKEQISSPAESGELMSDTAVLRETLAEQCSIATALEKRLREKELELQAVLQQLTAERKEAAKRDELAHARERKLQQRIEELEKAAAEEETVKWYDSRSAHAATQRSTSVPPPSPEPRRQWDSSKYSDSLITRYQAYPSSRGTSPRRPSSMSPHHTRTEEATTREERTILISFCRSYGGLPDLQGVSDCAAKLEALGQKHPGYWTTRDCERVRIWFTDKRYHEAVRCSDEDSSDGASDVGPTNQRFHQYPLHHVSAAPLLNPPSYQRVVKALAARAWLNPAITGSLPSCIHPGEPAGM